MKQQIRTAAASVCGMLMLCGPSFGQGIHIHAVKKLYGYQCMSLAHDWDGIGAQPAPVIAYASPSPSSPKAGFVASTVLAVAPMHVIEGRVSVLWPNGRTVWVDNSELIPFRVVSNPSAVCTPVVLSNGRYGTTGKF